MPDNTEQPIKIEKRIFQPRPVQTTENAKRYRTFASDIVKSTGRPRKWDGTRNTKQIYNKSKIPNAKPVDDYIQRREPVAFSQDGVDFTAKDVYYLLDYLPLMNPDVSHALHMALELANTGWTLSVKTPVEKRKPTGVGKVFSSLTQGARKAFSGLLGVSQNATASYMAQQSEASEEDATATALALKWLNRAGEVVKSDFPGMTGGVNQFIRSLMKDGFLKGAMAAEMVPNAALDDVVTFVTWEPLTAKFRRDPDNPDYLLIGQMQSGIAEGWQELNPNRVAYVPISGNGVYGDSPIAPAFHILPYWVRYYQDLQVYLHNSAWGWVDGEVDTEKLQLLWENMKPKEQAEYKSFMEFALATSSEIAEAYRAEGEKAPDGFVSHLDLLKLNAKGSASQVFPLGDAKRLLKGEIYNALHTPPTLMGEESISDAKFASLQIEAYHAFLVSLQNAVKQIIERFLTIAFTMVGYDKKIFVEFKFNPISIDDRLTTAQAKQLEIQNAIRLRDENAISQNEFSRRVTGTPAIGPAPLSGNADPDGPSAPDIEIMAQRQAGGSDNAAASGPSFGGKKQQTRDTNQAADKKNKQGGG